MDDTDYRIVTGIESSQGLFNEIMDLGDIVYPAEYSGEIENVAARYKRDPNQAISIVDKNTNKLVGNITSFPCTDELYEDVRYNTKIIRDDDIKPEEIDDYSTKRNNMFIISVAIHPDYRDGKAIKILMHAWIDYLNELECKGYPITTISGIVISEDGKKIAKRHMMVEERVLDDGNTLMICEGENLKKLLSHDF